MSKYLLSNFVYRQVKEEFNLRRCLIFVSRQCPSHLGFNMFPKHSSFTTFFPFTNGQQKHRRRTGPGCRFLCQSCDYATNLKGDFKRHELTHTGEKPHVCSICNKRFSLKGNLQTHLSLHERDKHFKIN
ncbi:hypothetical protein CDAR_379091 [Caerostris darwini]|uniref:C2H2-type domain-containing protein n=1 Tax=Caerostris darwini TaxID=1538125 RepID=A0AAV4TVG9_9ARAC|nr:hypothetical protein CDAR_379091 [Caerostris darwini]